MSDSHYDGVQQPAHVLNISHSLLDNVHDMMATMTISRDKTMSAEEMSASKLKTALSMSYAIGQKWPKADLTTSNAGYHDQISDTAALSSAAHPNYDNEELPIPPGISRGLTHWSSSRRETPDYVKYLEAQVKQLEESLSEVQQNHRSAADECLMLRYKNSLLERILLEKGMLLSEN